MLYKSKTFFTSLHKKQICLVFVFFAFFSTAQYDSKPEIIGDSIIYHLSIEKKLINHHDGNVKKTITVNGVSPAPTLHFDQGKIAVVYVTNRMKTESSIHWHGLLLPNLQDGVPYLTTPPIQPNMTYRFEFPLVQSGTYWYHSHTGLQEQEGLYGGIVIRPEQPSNSEIKDMVIVLSDWSNEDARSILKNLKRHNEWYSIKRKTSQPLIPSIKKGMFTEKINLYKNRMPDMHISDIYYDAFLANGKKEQHYRSVSPGEKIRLRVINAGASTYFWLNATDSLRVIAADGIDVVPTKMDRVLIAVAETYDFEITVPDTGAFHFQATAQNGSGSTHVFIGQEKNQFAPTIPKPDYFELMKKVAALHKGGHNSHMMKPYTKIIDNNDKIMPSHHLSDDKHKDSSDHMDMSLKTHTMMEPNITTAFDYNFLKSPQSTEISHKKATREVMMNLNANMLRYVWTINGKVLSEEDKILIKKGEKVRFIMNNNTMMHHPMHLHGHFFRVLNKNGSHSPLKHTVDIPPFECVTIEFDANGYGDWFFHCHILYHMSSGMARVVSYNTPRDASLKDFPYGKVLQHDQQFFHWYTGGVASNMGRLTYNAENTFNAFITELIFGWNNGYELDSRYERYINNFTRFNVGITVEDENADSGNDSEFVGYIGIRNQLLSILDVGINIDTKLRPELELEWHIGLLNRTQLTGHYEWKNDFGLIDDVDGKKNYAADHTFNFAIEHTITKSWSSNVNYDNRYGLGVGLMFLF